MLAERSKTPFVSEIVLLVIFILNELFIFLIDRVICQVHVLIVFVDFLGVSLRGKASKTFLVDIDTQGLVTCDTYIDAQVKLVSVNKEGVRNILADYTCFINIDVVNVVHDLDSTSLTCIRWFQNPYILLALVLFQLLVMIVKVCKFIGQDIGVGDEVKSSFTVSFLHANDIKTETIFARNLITLWKVVNFLIFI